ncbi:MAG: hypothetical protein WCB10_10465 [Steroidobacteraceae bacterium]
MPREWNLPVGGKNSDLDALFALNSGGARQHEGGFLKIDFARDVLHLCISHSARVRKHSQLVALQSPGCKYVELHKMQPAIRRPFD